MGKCPQELGCNGELKPITIISLWLHPVCEFIWSFVMFVFFFFAYFPINFGARFTFFNVFCCKYSWSDYCFCLICVIWMWLWLCRVVVCTSPFVVPCVTSLLHVSIAIDAAFSWSLFHKIFLCIFSTFILNYFVLFFFSCVLRFVFVFVFGWKTNWCQK